MSSSFESSTSESSINDSSTSQSTASRPATPAFLNVSDLSWQANGRSILKDINFDVQQGEFIGIIGPNGAGKTSLIHCLSRHISDYRGQITLNNQLTNTYSAKLLAQQIAVVMQQPSALFSLCLYEVVRMGLLPHKGLFSGDSQTDISNMLTAIEQVGLTQLKDKDFNQLSGGEQQRGLIARALVQQAQLLLLDEPSNHLDVFYQHQIMNLVKQLKLTAIMSIHDINLAAMYCQRIIVLDQGKIVKQGTVEQVINQSTLESVFKLPCHIDRCPLTDSPRVSFAPILTKQASNKNGQSS